MRVSALSYFTLWILQIVMGFGLLAVLRQVGLLHLRLRPLGPMSKEEGPALGTVVELERILPLESLRSKPITLSSDVRYLLILFVSPSCSVCRHVLPGFPKLAKTERRLWQMLAAVDNEAGAALRYLNQYEISDGVDAASLSLLDPGSRPFAVALESSGAVVGAGVVNTLEQLEILLDRSWEFSNRHAAPVTGMDLIESDSEGRELGHAATQMEIRMVPLEHQAEGREQNGGRDG
jgi:methylamine dehydrogenase accessory protein MauD